MSSWLSNAAAGMNREMREWLGSPAEIIFCNILPVFWALVVWALLGTGVMERVPTGFVNEDMSPLSREVERAISSNQSFGLVPFSDRLEALEAMRRGDVYGVVAIPFGYARDMLSGAGASVSLYVDENRYAVAGTFQAGMSQVMGALVAERGLSRALNMGDGFAGATRVMTVVHSDFYALGNMQYSFLAFLGSTLIPAVLTIGAIMGFVTCILRERWQNRLLQWLETSGNSMSAALVGKLLPHFLFYCLLFLAYIALFCGQGGFAPAGSIFLWFACGVCCMAVMAAMAMLFCAVAPTWRFALVMAAGYSAPALPFTGFSIPLDSMGPLARMFGECLPLTWLIQGQAQQWILGAGMADMGTTFLAFALIFLAPVVAGYPIFRWRYWRFALAMSK